LRVNWENGAFVDSLRACTEQSQNPQELLVCRLYNDTVGHQKFVGNRGWVYGKVDRGGLSVKEMHAENKIEL